MADSADRTLFLLNGDVTYARGEVNSVLCLCLLRRQSRDLDVTVIWQGSCECVPDVISTLMSDSTDVGRHCPAVLRVTS